MKDFRKSHANAGLDSAPEYGVPCTESVSTIIEQSSMTWINSSLDCLDDLERLPALSEAGPQRYLS